MRRRDRRSKDMGERKSQEWLVWAVLGLMLVAGAAALVLSPGGPGGGPPGQNHPPVPRITPSDASVNLGEAVEFSGANSSDPDAGGHVAAFAWSFGDGSSGAGAIVSHQYEVTGAYTVKLEATDDVGAKNSTTTKVWVNLNQPVGPGIATWNLYSDVPSNLTFPVDRNATRLTVSLQLNTSAFLGAVAIASLFDPNGAQVATQNVSVSAGSGSPVNFALDQNNLTTEGQWLLRITARKANDSQVTVTVGFQGLLRVEYKP
jgi:PKD repeat protein